MINTKLTRKAMVIAYNAHMGQFDKASVPYIYHPIHIAEEMDDEVSCIVALLLFAMSQKLFLKCLK